MKNNYENRNVLAGVYYRLSKEDGDKIESDSISNQRLLVTEYASEHGIPIIEEYVDDGYTGSNFDRPDFIRLMSDIEKEIINCIIIKDFSRLGRDYIEMGRLIMRTFPAIGVRIIAINDNYDSINGMDASDEITIPFKNLINDSYCRDISMKVRSQLDNKRKNGQFIGAFAAYGYIKDENDHNHLVIDETASEVVQLIFNMKLDGFNNLQIARKLSELSIPTPYEYKRMMNPNFKNGFSAKYNCNWSDMTVDRILKNEIYTGVLIQGKRRKINYKVKKITNVSSGEWYRTEGAHEAIIPREIFDIVQNLFKRDTRTAPGQDNVSLLSGFVKCADCGQNLIKRSSSYKGEKYFYYHCSSYAKDRSCTSHNIREDKLIDAVKIQIKNVANMLKDNEEIICRIKSTPNDRVSVKLINGQIESVTNEIKRYENMKAKLYMDFKDGLFDDSEFMDMNSNFSNRISEQKEALVKLQEKRSRLINLNISSIPWIKLLLECKDLDDIDRRMLIMIIDSVVVYDKNRIEVKFTNNDEFNELMSVINDIRNKEIVA